MKLYDIVKWDPEGSDGEEILVYKHEAEDFNTHTQLIVHSSQQAIFFKDGQALDLFDAGKHTLSSDNLPFLKKLINIPTGGQTPFHCEVYYINKIVLNDLKWGTPDPIPAIDPIEDVPVQLRANGYIGAYIEDARKFLLKVVGTRGIYTKSEFANYLRAKLIERVKGTLAQMLVMQKISVLSINAFMAPLSDELKKQLDPFFEEYGIKLVNFSFNSISPREEDLRIVTEARNNARKMDLESAALARKREREGYTYQQEKSFDVLKSAAQNEGTSGTMMGAGMGIGMGFGIGGAFGSGVNSLTQTMDVGLYGAGAQNVVNAGGQNGQVCAECGAKLPAGAKFCFSCGKEVIAPGTIICPACNTKLPAGAKFCFSCGKKLANVCVKCGKELPTGAKFCDGCGAPQE